MGNVMDDQLGRFLREWCNEIIAADKEKQGDCEMNDFLKKYPVSIKDAFEKTKEDDPKLFGKKLSDL